MSQRRTRAEPFTIKDCALIQIAAGERAQNFLITRHLREFLTLMPGLARGAGDRLDLD